MTKSIVILINFFVAGLGTLLGGKVIQGVIQLSLTILAWLLFFALFLAPVGMFIGAVSWIWALVTGLNWDAGKVAANAPKKASWQK